MLTSSKITTIGELSQHLHDLRVLKAYGPNTNLLYGYFIELCMMASKVLKIYYDYSGTITHSARRVDESAKLPAKMIAKIATLQYDLESKIVWDMLRK